MEHTFVGIDTRKTGWMFIPPLERHLRVRARWRRPGNLVARLGAAMPAIVVLEATAASKVVAGPLASGNLPLAVVNPRRVRA